MTTATSTAISTTGLFEMVLEVGDLEASERFYREVLGMPVANRWIPSATDDRNAVFLQIGPQSFLGLWPPESGGTKAIAGGRGGVHVHFALLVVYGRLAEMRAQIEAHGVEIIDQRDFGRGDHAIYVLDPDGNVVELTERRTGWAGRPMPG